MQNLLKINSYLFIYFFGFCAAPASMTFPPEFCLASVSDLHSKQIHTAGERLHYMVVFVSFIEQVMLLEQRSLLVRELQK